MKRIFAAALSAALPLAAQTFSNMSVQSQDLDVHSATITGNVSPDGWVSLEYGVTSGGPYPFQTTTTCTASPEIVLSGGGGSGARAWALSLGSGGSAGLAFVSYGGSGYGSVPSVTVSDTCVPDGGAAGSGMTGAATISGGAVTSVVLSGGTGYHLANGATSGEYGPNQVSGVVRIAVGGLAAGTTYYIRPVFRPDPNSSTGQVVGSEFSFTTLNGTTAPVAPVAPATVWNPASPANFPSFTTGYTLVSMASSGGDCTAKNSVTGSYWSVTAGDAMQMVLNEVGYGAIIELDQGTICKIPSSLVYYTLPAKATDPAAAGINDPAHRYIVIRTKQTGSADFPPPGTRFDPAGDNGTWLAHLAQIQSQSPQGQSDDAPQVLRTDPGNCTAHHWFIYNVELSVAGLGNWGSAAQIGTDNDPIEEACEPPYMVFDRTYWHGPTRVANTTTMSGGLYGSPGGHFSLTNSVFDGYDTNNPQTFSVILSDCGAGPAMIDNNLFGAASGQGFYVQSDGVPYCGSAPASPSVQNNPTTYDDGTFTHNALYWNPTTLNSYSLWDGLSRLPARNQFEIKGGRRWSLSGNYFNGQWCAQTDGSPILLSATNVAAEYGESGVTDVAMSSNVFVNSAIVLNIQGTKGTSQTGPPDNSINRHFSFTNNIGWNLGKNLWHDANTCSGIGPGYFDFTDGPQDIDVENNTLADVSGDTGSNGGSYYPTWLEAGGGVSLTAGFTLKNNVWHMSGGGDSLYGILPDNEPGCAPLGDCANFPAVPNLDNSNNPASTLQSAYISNGTSGLVKSAFTWLGNIDIGGWYATNLTPWTQMTPTQINTLSANLPSGDTWISGSSIAARQANAGVAGIDSGNMNCWATPQNSCVAGASIQELESVLGIVTNVSVFAGASTLQFNYVAPDSRSCAVDTSANGTVWTRAVDGGGSRVRMLAVNGLNASSPYQYRLMCYYSQTAPWFSFPSELSNMVTDGATASTAAAGTRGLLLYFNLPPGAVSAQFTATGLGGSPLTATCSTSPCGIADVPNGNVFVEVQYLNGAGGAVSSGTLAAQ